MGKNNAQMDPLPSSRVYGPAVGSSRTVELTHLSDGAAKQLPSAKAQQDPAAHSIYT